MVKFLDATEEDIQAGGYTNEELDVLLQAHQILTAKKIKKGRIIEA